MDKLKELLKKLSDLDEAIDAMLADDEPMDDKEKEALAKHQADRVKCLAAIGREKERLARVEQRDQLSAEADTIGRVHAAVHAHDGRRTDASPTTTNAGETVPAAVAVVDKRRGFKTPREYLLCVMDAGQGRRLDKRLVPLQATVGSDEQRGIYDPSGGFLVPEDFHPGMLRIKPELDPMGELTRKIPMGKPIVRIPARSDKNHTTSVAGGLTFTRRPESVAGTPSVMTLEQVTMEAHTLFGLSYATEEILMDSPESFIAILEEGFSEQHAYHLINERLNGTGVGEYLGVLNAGNGALITVDKRLGQAAKTIVYENILDMVARCWGYGNAVWLANHDTLPQLGLLNQQVGTAGTGMIWQASAREGTPNLLMGRPVMFSEYAQTLGTAGDIGLYNWQEYLEGLYQPMQSAESVHVRFVNHERAFKFFERNDGRPWWRVPITPKNSTSTLSPFVVLQTRS